MRSRRKRLREYRQRFVPCDHAPLVTHYVSIPPGSGTYTAFDVTPDHLIPLQVGYPGHTGTITTSAHWSAAGCVFQSQATAQ